MLLSLSLLRTTVGVHDQVQAYLTSAHRLAVALADMGSSTDDHAGNEEDVKEGFMHLTEANGVSQR